MTKPPLSPFEIIHKRASTRLENFFHRCENVESALFLDPGLDIIISRIVHPDLIKSCFKKVFTYQSNREFFDYDKILIFTTGENNHLAQYVDLLSSTEKPPRSIVVVFTNRFSFIARQYFEMRGFLHKISTEELRLPAWILDPDYATIELQFAFSDLYIENGGRCIQSLSNIIKSIPSYDYYSNVYMIGQASIEIGKALPTNFHSAWTHILIFDRRVDSVTPFLTAMSYEAIVAELVGMTYGFSHTPKNDLVLFSDQDPNIAHIRSMPYDEAAKEASSIYQTFKEDITKEKEGSIEKMRSLEKNVKNATITDHVNIISEIPELIAEDPNFNKNLNHEMDCYLNHEPDINFIKDSIALSPTWHTPVRLLALYCQTTNKIPQDIDEIRTMIIDRFGLEALAALWSLEEANIIKSDMKPTYWYTIMKKFELFNKTPEKKSEKPYDGYTPLVVRLLQKIIKKQWNQCHLILEQLKIPFRVDANRCSDATRVLCVFVGGATYGELAALRSSKGELLVHIDILTTQAVSPKKVLDQFAGLEFT